MTSKNKYIVWFDIETTGIDPKTDRIIQIGMIKTDKKYNVIDAVEQKINPCGVKSKPEAFEQHQITDEELLSYPSFSEVADDIIEFMDGCDLGGHNCIKFDIPFLMEEMNKNEKDFSVEKRRIFDTKLMDNHYNFRKLANIYKEYCPDADLGCNAHDAICDTQMCIEVYKAMLEKHNPTVQEIDEINHNNSRIDMAGFFIFNENMKVCMGKGKYIGKLIEEVDRSYFEWMIKNDFPKETISLARRCLAYVSRQNH